MREASETKFNEKKNNSKARHFYVKKYNLRSLNNFSFFKKIKKNSLESYH